MEIAWKDAGPSRRLGTESLYKAAVYAPGNVLGKTGGPGSRSGRCAAGISSRCSAKAVVACDYRPVLPRGTGRRLAR
ncbi:hypothetical protein ACU4GD_09885 [Cupriavidus basilensis]